MGEIKDQRNGDLNVNILRDVSSNFIEIKMCDSSHLPLASTSWALANIENFRPRASVWRGRQLGKQAEEL